MRKSGLSVAPRRWPRPRLLLAGVFVLGSVHAQIAFNDATIRAGLGGTASETWGAAWGDVNGDLHPDVFASNHRNRATLLRNNRDGTFSEVSRQVDVSRTPGWTGGRANVDTHAAAWADLDNDGDADLVEAVEIGTDLLRLNDYGLLTDGSYSWGVSVLPHNMSRQPVLFDYNGDGRLDLASIALQRPGFAPQLRDGSFGSPVPMACGSDGQWGHLVDIHPTPGLEFVCAPRNGSYPKVNAFADGAVRNVSGDFPQFSPVIDAATLDYDGDRRPDVLLLRGSERPSDAFQPAPDRFEAQLITGGSNVKSVTFRTAGVLTITASLSAGSDAQGDPAYIDVGSAQWSPASLTFQLSRDDSRNWGIGSGSPGINVGYLPATGEWKITQGGGGGFRHSYLQVRSSAQVTGLIFGGASAVDRGAKPILLRNTSNGLVAVGGVGFDQAVRCQSVVAGDFDNDMDEDVFLACTRGANNIANQLYRNNGNGTFTRIADAGGAAGRVGAAVGSQAGTSESVIVADYDLDGFLDLLVTNGNNMRPVYYGGGMQLFRNRGNGNRWLQLDLVGTASNRDAVGAQVYVTAGGRTQYREQNGGYHRWSQNHPRIHVGLGAQTQADVTIRWPDGATTRHSGLQANRLYQVRQNGTSSVLQR